jgi:hypothetical protein
MIEKTYALRPQGIPPQTTRWRPRTYPKQRFQLAVD